MEGFKKRFALWVAAALEVLKLEHPEMNESPESYVNAGEFLDILTDLLENMGAAIPVIPIGTTVFYVYPDLDVPGEYCISEETVKGFAVHKGQEFISIDDSMDFWECDFDNMFPTREEAEAYIEILKKEAA